MNRRSVLAAAGTVGVVSISGCLFEGFGAGAETDEGDIDGHESGDIEIVIDGEPVDLEADRFQAENVEGDLIDFHLHEGDDQWYMDRNRVTFAEGIDLLPHFEYDRVDGEDVVTYDGTVYDGGDPETELRFLIDDDPVDPTERELRDGDALRLEISTDRDE